MGFKCPKCSEEIDAVSQDTLRERLKAKDEENKELKTQLKTAQDKAKEAEGAVQERDQLKAEITRRDQQAERAAAFDELGIPNTPAVRKGFETIYSSEMAGLEQPVAFKDWLAAEETKGHPLLAGHYKAQGGTQGTTGGTTGGGTASGGTSQGSGTQGGAGGTPGGVPRVGVRPQGGLTNVDRGAESPSSQSTGPTTAAELQQYLHSAEYRALSKEKQKETLARLKSQLTGNTRA